ncbi:metallophosphoesterase [Spirosoma pollinicola]|uniref:Calcineurin-like phosphoesterase domain-containing protein n=1 Tax=Spirosoma pollinicola TaxID=2057025 RepID=A0A2K8YTE9_9BACT|nr:metallophosphoesterase [Spirosoma pollinicola]AUD00887.1 hypothetical protein CWM47_03085 [Spirosoma pollinicola]
MRIIQLSDIHLSSSNIAELRNYYLEALINDLDKFHNDKPIDIILLTGDLVDKGGEKLGDSPYEIFKEIFIDKIQSKFNLNNNQILFIPGNHDIQQEHIDDDIEFALTAKLTKELANERLKQQRDKIIITNKRVEKFKEFEKSFHKDRVDYIFSYNESLAIFESDGLKVGFALINDSWRCSPSLKKENHFIGTDQLFNSKSIFEQNSTLINIAVFHHPLDSFNNDELESINNILQNQKFDIAFFGHIHQNNYQVIKSSTGGLLMINGRSAFNNSNELQSKYQPGYNIFDLDINSKRYTLYARKFILSGFRFEKDVDSLPNGQKSGVLGQSSYHLLNNETQQYDVNLPSAYSADVTKIVTLLIGDSLYPKKYIFVRELIQNSVDACNRIKGKYPSLTPKIIVHINFQENSFEIIDEGDGMNKRVLRENFAIIGKSISQEFNQGLNQNNLISQFGIGFISTFIVAKSIYIRTESEEDGLINFEIENVFEGFTYNPLPTWEAIRPKNTGTSIKVFLKPNFFAAQGLQDVTQYCRHISNLEYYFNGQPQSRYESWNTEGGKYFFNLDDLRYTCRISLGTQSNNFIASNAGFYINTNSTQLLPPYFPSNISGEVNFTPRSIDFDLSRTNIMESAKSIDFRRTISVTVKKLFREAIDSKDTELLPSILIYLQYYLAYFDINFHTMNQSYLDFYSKKELIQICCESLTFEYKYSFKSLKDILVLLNHYGINTIYINTDNGLNELISVYSKYLNGIGNFIFRPLDVVAPFLNNSQNFNTFQSMQVIALEYGMQCINIGSIVHQEIDKILIRAEIVPKKLSICIDKIKDTNSIEVKFAQFGTDFKLLLISYQIYYINFDHPSFQSLLINIEGYSDETIDIYVHGILELNLGLRI